MTIQEWAKANAKDGANFAELDELVERANPINRIKSKDDAEVFIKENGDFRSLFDSYVSKAVEAHDVKFKESKLPDILKEEREKIRTELNPKETDDQKALREIREELAGEKQARKLEVLKGSLRGKAKDAGIDEEIAESFSVFGDESEAKLSALSEYMTGRIQSGIEEGIKGKFKGRQAPGAGKPAGSKTVSRGDWDGMSPQQQSSFVADGGDVVDE